jgi:hypothetical protein
MYKNYKLLKNPSPLDSQDYHVSLFANRPKAFPKEYFIKTCAKVKDQGETSTCVGHSLSTVKEAIEWVQRMKKMLNLPNEITDFNQLLICIEAALKTNPALNTSLADVVFSPGFVYADRAVTDSQDEGMVPREALKELKKNGLVTADLFPFLGDYPTLKAKFEENKDTLLKVAEPYKITGYARLHTIEDIRTALLKLGPVTICIPVYQSFYSVGADGMVPLPNYNRERIEGYHEITIMGYREDLRYRIQNSWGEDWANKGFCNLSFNYPIAEAWSITDTIMPDTVTPLVPVPKLELNADMNVMTIIKLTLRNAVNMLNGLIESLDKAGV